MTPSVMFFIPSLRGGGAERCTYLLATGLANRGFRISLVLANAEGPYLDTAARKLPIVDLRTRNIWRSILPLARHISYSHPDVLISALDHANIAALCARRLSGADSDVIVSTHTMVSIALKSKSRFTSRVLPLAMRLIYPDADSVVAVSRAVASDLSSVTGIRSDAIRVVPNPVPIHDIAEMSLQRPDTSWFTDRGPPVVIAVGSLWPHKDHATLIQAVDIARRSRHLRLIILGEGPERPHLAALVHRLGLDGSVLMPGFVDNPYAWVAHCSTFVLSSKWEGMGTVLVEAMACGVTPVATDCPGGPSEILENGRFGYLTPVGNAEAMATAILESLERPMDPLELKRHAETFSVGKAVDAYMGIIADLGKQQHQWTTRS